MAVLGQPVREVTQVLQQGNSSKQQAQNLMSPLLW
jgi:hypothetical protein